MDNAKNELYEKSAEKTVDADITLVNGDSSVGESDSNGVSAAAVSMIDELTDTINKTNGDVPMSGDVSEILDFIDSIQNKVQQALEEDELEGASEQTNVTESNNQQNTLPDNVSDDKTTVDTDKIEIVNDLDSEIVDITSDDEDQPSSTDSTVQIKPTDASKGEIAMNAANIKIEDQKPQVNSIQIAPIVIDIDDDDDIEVLEPTKVTNDKPNVATCNVSSSNEISSIDLDDDGGDVFVDMTKPKDGDKEEKADTIKNEVLVVNDNTDELVQAESTVVKPENGADDQTIAESDAVVDSSKNADSSDAATESLPTAQNVVACATPNETDTAVGTDMDQGNNLLEEMSGMPTSSGDISESSTNEDEDIDHFASDDIILMPFDDEISKSSAFSEASRETTSVTVSSNDAVTNEKSESNSCEIGLSLSRQASVEVVDSLVNAELIEPIEQGEQADVETPDQSGTTAPTGSVLAQLLENAESSVAGDDSVMNSSAKKKLDTIDCEEVQPAAKKPRTDSLFDSIKETEVESTSPCSESEKNTHSSNDQTVQILPDDDVVSNEVSGEPIESSDEQRNIKRRAESDLLEEPKKQKLEVDADTDAKTEDSTETEKIESVPAENTKLVLTPEPIKQTKRQTLELDFLKKFKKQFDQMTKEDLEHLVMEKIVEAIVHKSEYSDLRDKADAQEQIIQALRGKVQELSKQYRDLDMVHNRVVHGLETRNQNAINPVKITRAVGLQVQLCVMKKDGGVVPAPPVSQSMLQTRQPAAPTAQQKKDEMSRRAAMVLQQNNLQKIQQQAALDKKKMQVREEMAKKNKMMQQKTSPSNHLLHNQQLRLKAQSQKKPPTQMVTILPKTVAQPTPLRKSLQGNPPQLVWVEIITLQTIRTT